MKPVQLRNVTADDLPVFYKHQRDAAAAQMAAFLSREWDAFGAHWNKILANEDVTKQTILYDGQVAGHMVCFERDGKLEIGYWIGKEFWGLGIATGALEIFLNLVKTRPLFGLVAKHNIASRRVLEKCGFELIGEDSWTPVAGGEEYILILK
jgi:RimJ/RimL family protein N-acetyltransferase